MGQTWQFEFRAEAFNLLNNVDFGQPSWNLNAGAAFSTIDITANSAREIQLVAKFIFLGSFRFCCELVRSAMSGRSLRVRIPILQNRWRVLDGLGGIHFVFAAQR
jgi:hypothetical protein